jgi:hypothetical protein
MVSNQPVQLDDVGIIKDKTNCTGSTQVIFLKNNVTINLTPEFIEPFNIHETGDPFSHKICDRCFKRLPTESHFSNNRHKKDNFITKRPSCKECRKKKDGKSIPKKDRDKWESKRPSDYSIFTCPICSKSTIVGISKIVLDHNHQNGKVRGFLCESCNTGIGRFDDDTTIIERAINWLKND